MLHRFLLAPFVLLLALLAVPSAAAQGLVQLRLEGAVAHLTDPPGSPVGIQSGHLVEVEIGALAADTEHAVVLHLHVARGTTGAELAELVAARLGRVKISAKVTLAGDTAGSVWIDRATHVNVRVGAGLTATIACVEGAPASVMVHSPSSIATPSTMVVAASTAIPVKGRPPIRAHTVIRAELAADESSAEFATALWKAASEEEWVTHRPGAQAWSPTGMASGAEITGLSMSFGGTGDWRVEVSL